MATLQGESLARRSPLFDSLQLSRCQGNPCENIRHCPEFTVFHPRLDAVAETAVVQVICWHQSVDLVVLRKEGPNTWHWVDTVALTNRYGDLQLGFESVVKAPVQEIVVRNDEGYAGTGAFGGVFMLLKLVEGRMKLVFGSGDTGRLAPDMTEFGRAVSQNVQWKHDPGTPTFGPELTLTTQYSTDKGDYRVRRRFGWSERWQMFLPDYPDEIESLPASGRRAP